MKKALSFIFTLFIAATSVACVAQVTHAARPSGTWDVFDSGAKGDGETMDTKAIQTAIDRCHAAGGGRVYLHNGQFLSGTIYLKSHVTLFIEAGATLLGSANVDDYPITASKYPAYTGDLVTNKAFIYAEDAENISIQGRGTIDGRGDDFHGPYLFPSFSGRPRIIHLRNCRDVQVRDLTLRNSGSWVQSYQSCRNLVIDGITVDSRENKDIEKPRYATVGGRNTDGLDLVDCELVRISNCFIDSGDDAICLKSFSPDEGCRNITITNCTVSSNASGIKIGTETSGAFEDITISNCTVFDTRVDGISIMTVDGARIERITISNILMRRVRGAPIFIRLGSRNRLYRKNVTAKAGILRDVQISNVQGDLLSGWSCSITGVPGFPVENIVLKDIRLRFTKNDAEQNKSTASGPNKEVPELEKDYPNGKMFGRLPASGFFIRHAKNITLDRVSLDFTAEENRPALVTDDVVGLEIIGLRTNLTKVDAIQTRNTTLVGQK